MREIPIKGLHHTAYRCRDVEETRKFYEDFLGLPLANAFEITTTQTGRDTNVLHVFFEMADGSFIAFFDDPDTPFDFKKQRDFDLHLALRVDMNHLKRMYRKGQKDCRSVRGPIDHGFINSIYFRDPNGYVVELSAPVGPDDVKSTAEAQSEAREVLSAWSRKKRVLKST